MLTAPPAASATITASVDGDVIQVQGGPEGNTIEVFYSPIAGELRFSDPAGVVGTPSCPQDGAELNCPVTDTTRRVEFVTGGGKDTVEFLISYRAFLGPALATDFDGGGGDDVFEAVGRGVLEGGAGRDRLTGGADTVDGSSPDNRLRGGGGRDRLVDTEGNDKLSGGGGPDVLVGGDDRDRYNAGPGRDVVRARDFTKDLGINCGPGRDVLRSDPFDPRPRSC